MKTKTETAKEKWLAGDKKGALAILKTFTRVTPEQKRAFSVAYECLVHPKFYLQTHSQEWVDAAIQRGYKIAALFLADRVRGSELKVGDVIEVWATGNNGMRIYKTRPHDGPFDFVECIACLKGAKDDGTPVHLDMTIERDATYLRIPA